MKKRYLTANQGVPVTNNQNSLTVGERGSVLLQDVHLIEKLAHFDRERIPERVVHAKGAGAHGYFQVYQSMAKYTKAKFLQDPEKKTPVFADFSTPDILYVVWQSQQQASRLVRQRKHHSWRSVNDVSSRPNRHNGSSSCQSIRNPPSR